MNKTKHIHLVGMGAPGCMLARMLQSKGYQNITWNDLDAPNTAWRASTGAIYPANSQKFGDDNLCHKFWDETLRHVIPFTETCRYWFNHKSPPHEGDYDIIRKSPGGLQMARPASFHLNSQALVSYVRKQLMELRTDEVPKGAKVIHTHGWTKRLSHVYWGWTVRVQLDYDRDTFGPERPCFYFREGRYVMAYAYPIPSTPYWYAGSSIIKQSKDKMKSLEIEPKYDRWKENFERLSHGEVKVIHRETQGLEGWRPACGDSEWVVEKNGELYLRPLWNSGLRHFPHQWFGVCEKLGIKL